MSSEGSYSLIKKIIWEEYIIILAMPMAEEEILKELDELSEIVEGGENRTKMEEELKVIEEITSETEEEKEEKVEEKVSEKKEEVEEKPEEEKPKEKKEVEKKREKPEKMIGRPLTFYRIASASIIAIGLIIYGLAFYLRWEGWRLIRYPPSGIVAIVGTLLILGGGEIYYRGKTGK